MLVLELSPGERSSSPGYSDALTHCRRSCVALINCDYVRAMNELNTVRRQLDANPKCDQAFEIAKYVSEATSYILRVVSLIESRELKELVLIELAKE